MHNRSAFGSASFRFAVPALFLMGAATAEAQFDTANNTFPSVDGMYVQGSAPTHYQGGALNIEMTNMRLVAPANGPGLTGPTFHIDSFFDVFLELSINGGPPVPMSSPGSPVTVQGGGGGAGGTGIFQTEMLSLNITTGNGFMLRESPSRPSLGQLKVADNGGGMYHIDSFFDVFTELSIDGGQTWMPSVGDPTHLDARPSGVVPEPTTLVAMGLGLVALARKRGK